ncbi:hypothetical protein D3C87_333250 [compost metagenome]
MIQEPQYNARVGNITFRDIDIEKQRSSFTIHDKFLWNRYYYNGEVAQTRGNFVFDDIKVLRDKIPEKVIYLNTANNVDFSDMVLEGNHQIIID